MAKKPEESALALLAEQFQDRTMDPVEFLARAHETMGPSFQVGEVLFESRTSVAQSILNASGANRDLFRKSEFLRSSMGEAFGQESLFVTDGKGWQDKRELLLPFFMGKQVLSEEKHQSLLATLEAHIAELPSDSTPVDLHHWFRQLTLDMACQHIFDVQLSKSELKAFADDLDQNSQSSKERFFGLSPAKGSPPELDGWAELLLSRSGGKRCALSALREAPFGQDPKNLKNEVVALALLGHETTASLLSWSLAELSRHPEKQQSIRQEMEEKGNPQKPTLPYTQSLASVRDVIRETSRFHAPNYLVSREAREDVELETAQGNFKIAAGTQVLMTIQELNQDRDYWSDPEHWNPDQNGSRHYAFGAGQRLCLGQLLARLETNLVLSQLVDRFDISRAEVTLQPSSSPATRPQENPYRLNPRR